MKVEFKFNIKQPVFFLENSTIKKGYVVRQHFSNEVHDFALPATDDNLKSCKNYQIQLHDQNYKSISLQEENLFASRTEFFERMTESWDSL